MAQIRTAKYDIANEPKTSCLPYQQATTMYVIVYNIYNVLLVKLLLQIKQRRYNMKH
jgi:hypothetical protein